jgi:hypothetical protein
MATVNLKQRKLIDAIGTEMIMFLDGLKRNDYFKTKDLYDRFIVSYPERRNYVTQNKMTSSIKAYCKFYKLNCHNPISGGISKVMIEDPNYVDFEDKQETPF